MSTTTTRRPGRSGRALLAGAILSPLLAAGVAPGPARAATTPANTISGSTRYDTARLAALAAFPAGASKVVLASGTNFPDGLAAAYLAGALGAPLLLTAPGSLPQATTDALSALHAQTVQVVGGPAAVASGVLSALQTAGYTVPTAISGADRYATAAAIAAAGAAQSAGVGAPGGKKTAILATGTNFPDALSAGAAAYADHLPILLTSPDTLSSSASSAITSLGVQKVIIMGGTGAVSSAVETAVQALSVGGSAVATVREQGPTRFATAVAMAGFETTPVSGNGLGLPLTNVVLASGYNFPDALVSAEFGAPVLLGDPFPAVAAGFLSTNGTRVANLEALGGPLALPPADVAAAQSAVSSAAGTAILAAQAGGVTFTVAFDQPVLAPGPTNFIIDVAPAGVGIQAVWPTATANTYLAQLAAPLVVNDVIAVNPASPPLTVNGSAVQPVATTVGAATAPTFVAAASQFNVGGIAVKLKFSKPVSTATLAAGLALTSAGGAILDPAPADWAVGADRTSFSIPVTAKPVGTGDTLQLKATIADLSPTPVTLGSATTLTATAQTTAPKVSSATVGSRVDTHGSTTFSHVSDAGGAGPLPAGDTLAVQARPGSAADGINGAIFKLAFAAPSATASAVQLGATVASGVRTLTVTVPSTAGIYPTTAALASALNASPDFSPYFVATGTGAADLSTTVASTAAQAVVGGSATWRITVTLSEPVLAAVPTAAVADELLPAKYTVSSGAAVTTVYPLDDAAGPTVLGVAVVARTAAQLVVAGTTTVSLNGTVADYADNTMAVPATVTAA